jgi:hypothetical protein
MARDNEGRIALLELSFAFMGALKLLGLETRLFRRMGLTPRQMRHVGMIETAGALMVANEGTRTLGAVGLAGVSALMLVAELRSHEAELVLPRLALTGLAARTAFAARSGRA